MTNKEFPQNNEIFVEACRLAKIPPTVRQASKFRIAAKLKIFKGLASQFRYDAIRAIRKEDRN